MELNDLIKNVEDEFGMNDLTEIIDSGAVQFCYKLLTDEMKNRTCIGCEHSDALDGDIINCTYLDTWFEQSFSCKCWVKDEQK